MTRQIISTGTAANDGTGDTLRSAGVKINENFKSISAENSEIASHLFSHNELNTDKEMVEVSVDSVSSNQLESNNSSDDDMLMLLYLCAILIPFVAVGISTDWDVKKVLINVLLTFLCYIPGVIHAFITIRDYYR